MARGTRRRSRSRRRPRRSGYQRLLRKKTKCPGTVKRVCKVLPTKRNKRTKRIRRGGQVCRVVAGSYKSKWTSAGSALRSMLKLKARLGKKGCAVGVQSHLGRHRRRRR